MKKLLILSALFLALSLNAQDSTFTIDRQSSKNNMEYKPGNSRFLLRGFWYTGFDATTMVGGETEYNFIGGGFNPVFLYKQSDRLFFEAELEGGFSNNQFELDLGYANVSYVLNKYVTVRAGKFLLPFGTFVEKLHPAWINRMADAPLGFGHDGIAPSSDIGVELRGAFHTGSVKWNYQAYIINGPQLKDGSDEPDEAGGLKFGYMGDNNKSKSLGWRVGFMPFANQAVEIGLSGLSGVVGADDSEYEGVKSNLYALDFSWVKTLSFMSSIMDIKGQYNLTNVDDASYFNPEDSANYSFVNSSNAYFIQLSIRPALVSNNFISKLELVGRYSTLHTPDAALWKTHQSQIGVGLNYWIDWRTVVKLGFSTTDGVAADHEGGIEDGETGRRNLIYLRWAMGF